ncbi:MAG: hypothetical protein ACW9W3_07550 [Candidatus Nitrosopumilus sp. bin_68KS]
MKLRMHSKDDQLELMLHIRELISDGTIRTKDISEKINRSERQTRRYLVAMSQQKMISLTDSKRLDKSQDQIKKHNFNTISRDSFVQIPEIKQWIDGCLARGLKFKTISRYISYAKFIFNFMSENPSNALTSKDMAIKFWVSFAADFRRHHPSKGTQCYRVTYKNLLAAHNIFFANRMGKIYGLSSSHDRFAPYAGVHFTSDITKKISDMILEDGNFALYVWWRIALRTGARSSAISTMTWDRVYLDSHPFKLEQHETKDPRGHIHLGQDGEWKQKYVPEDLRKILLQWKTISPNSCFFWFAEKTSHPSNQNEAHKIQLQMSQNLKKYYLKISHLVPPQTREYMMKRPDHMLRHTLVQQLKDSGFTNEEIADSFGWRSSDVVKNWYSKTSEKNLQDVARRAEKICF